MPISTKNNVLEAISHKIIKGENLPVCCVNDELQY